MVTTGAVARALGVSINTVKAWIRAGKVEAIRLPSGHYRIPERELARLQRGEASSDLPERYRRWLAGLREFEEWRLAQPVEDRPFAETLAWVDGMLRVARQHRPLPEPSPKETAARVLRLHRVLARART